MSPQRAFEGAHDEVPLEESEDAERTGFRVETG